MVKKMIRKSVLVLLIASITLGGFGVSVRAAIDLPWNTSFNKTCDVEWQWTNTYPRPWSPGVYHDTPPCYPEYDRGLDEACSGGEGEQITAAANMATGAGGLGQRHWMGDGENVGSGGLAISFNSPQTELWVRWYVRFENGFKWGPFLHSHKMLYFDVGGNDQFQPNFWGGDRFRIYAYGTEAQHRDIYSAEGTGWDTIMVNGGDEGSGHKTSDGQFHCYEIHVKQESSLGATDGIAEMWLDGNMIIQTNNFQFGSGGAGWESFLIPSNQKYPNNSRCITVDIDNIKIVGYGDPSLKDDGNGNLFIGPLNATNDTTPPNVSIISPTQGQTVSGDTTISANASDNVGVSGVQFKLNGANLGAEDTTSPYSITWDTTTVSDGSYNLTATARDAAGNNATSTPVSVTVNNSASSGTIFFQEPFEDTSFGSRGWYDNLGLTLSSAEHISGSNSSVEFHFNFGGTTPTSGAAIRHKFTDSDEVYLSYWVKYSSNWEGSNRAYHPHEFQILTNENGDWTGPAYTHLTAYVEQNEGEPLLAIQDAQNIDESNIGVDLTGVTENRSVAGCNGDGDGYGAGDCYPVGALHRNGKDWRAGGVYFQDTPGQYYKNDWHFIEAYFKLNSISSDIGVAEGVMRYWYDGNLIINHTDVMMRTGLHPGMKFNQFIIAPWIGDGSPVAQTFWVDNLTVADYRVDGGSCPTYHKTDTNLDGLIDMPELMVFIARWKSNDGVTKQDVEEARYIWFSGGAY